MDSLVKHGYLGVLSAWQNAKGEQHSYFVEPRNTVGWLWTDLAGVMLDEPANDPS